MFHGDNYIYYTELSQLSDVILILIFAFASGIATMVIVKRQNSLADNAG